MNTNITNAIKECKPLAVCYTISSIFKNKAVISEFLRLAAVIVFLLWLSSAKAIAQYYDIGSEKSSVKWKSVKSKNFEIIFPQSAGKDFSREEILPYSALAKRYLKNVEAAYGIYADSVKFNYGISGRFPLVLHPFNAESNGFTVWAPRQIDFFAQPPLDLISSEPWDVSLATHEGRHAWQVAHFNRGIFKVLYWMFGEQVVGGASGIYPSRWFLEGDAVVAETQMSKGGRGRSGFFLQRTLKGIISEDTSQPAVLDKYFYGKNRSWDRWRFGSVKAFSPNQYDVGYMINSMARYHSGDVELAHKILNYEPLHFYSANVVASAFKRYSGKTHREYVKDSLLQEFRRLNSNEKLDELLGSAALSLKSNGETPSEPMFNNPLKRTGVGQGYYSEYKHIQVVGKDSVMALVHGYGSPGYFVLITRTGNGSEWKESVIRPFNYDFDPSSYHDGKLYWSEYTVDPRWSQHSVYSVCYIDHKTGVVEEYPNSEYERLPHFIQIGDSPAMFTVRYEQSEDSEGNPELYSILHSIDASQAESSSEEFPVFKEKGQIVSFVLNKFDPSSDARYKSDCEAYYALLDERGISLVRGRYGFADSEPVLFKEELLPPSFHIIKELKMFNGELFFITDMFGAPVLCRMNPSTKQLRIASASTGISSYSIADDGALYVVKDYGDRGALPFRESLLSIDIPSGLEFKYPLAEELARQYNEKYRQVVEDYAKKIEDNLQKAEEKDYSKAAHLFRIHSWAPVFAEFSGITEGAFDEFYDEALPGVTVYSQNTLGTMRASAGYAFEKRDGYLGASKNLHSAHASINWSGWYPVIEGDVHFNDRIMYEKGRHSFRSSAVSYIPLEWEADGWVSGLTPALGWSYRNDQVVINRESAGPSEADPESDPEYIYTLSQIDRHQMTFSLGAYKMHSVAKAQVYPRWGIGASLKGSVNPSGGENFGSEVSAYVYGYVPGLAFNQGLRLSAAFQRQNVEDKKYWLTNHIDIPRGFTEEFFGRNYFRITADYAVPIYLGDVSLGPIAYLQQLQIIPFIDYSQVDFLRSIGTAKDAPVHYQWESRYSFGADVMLRGHFLRIGYPMYIGVRYAHTNKPGDIGNMSPGAYMGNGSKDYFSLLLGVSIY